MKTYKSNAEFFGYSIENERQSLPEHVQILLVRAIGEKESNLNTLYKSTLYLPKSLLIEQLKKEIFKTNDELILLSERNNFDRYIFDIKSNDNWNWEDKFKNNDWYNCFDTLNDTEYLQYLNYPESSNYRYDIRDIKILPKFDLITDYLALIAYYDYLMISLNATEIDEQIIELPTREQQMCITIEQRRDVIDKPKIYPHNRKNENYMHDYLSEIKTSFDLNKKGTFGAVCLALHSRKIFNARIDFKTLIEKLSKYWNIEPPKDKHPNKYKDKKNDLINKYEILERKII